MGVLVNSYGGKVKKIMKRLTDAQIDIRVKIINNNIENLKKDRDELDRLHILNCVYALDDCLSNVSNSLNSKSCNLMKTITCHIINFMNGCIPNVYCDFTDYAKKIKEIENESSRTK